MGTTPKHISESNAALGLLPLRQHWQQINRQQRAEEAATRARQKEKDKRRAKCRCEAYPWPHRPGGGFCRFPDLPLQKWRRDWKFRPYRCKYTGLRRQLARANGLHPIRDRALLREVMWRIVALAREAKRQAPRAKYRNMLITDDGVTARWQSAGPMM